MTPPSRSSPSPPRRSPASRTGATPPSWQGRSTARRSRSSPERSSSGSSANEHVDTVVFAYSDVPHETVMHAASRVLAAGADFTLLGPDRTMLKSRRPVLAVGATRTGAGKSQTTRYLAALLAERGITPGRHPPSDALRRPRRAACPAVSRPTTTSTDTRRRSRSERNTSPTSTPGASSTPASTTRRSCTRPSWRPTSSCGTAATTTSRSIGPDLYIVVADPLRPGDERRYHPGETNLRMADVVIINKIDSAEPAAIAAVRAAIEELNPAAQIVTGALRPDARRSVDRGQARRRGRGRPDADPRRHAVRRRGRRRPAVRRGPPGRPAARRCRLDPRRPRPLSGARAARARHGLRDRPDPRARGDPQRRRRGPRPVGDADRPDSPADS